MNCGCSEYVVKLVHNATFLIRSFKYKTHRLLKFPTKIGNGNTVLVGWVACPPFQISVNSEPGLLGEL